jgi:predicted acylesterase/phospholipase RssA
MSAPLVIGVDGDAALAWGLAAALRREGRAPPVLIPVTGAAGPMTSRAGVDVVRLDRPLEVLLERLGAESPVLVWGDTGAQLETRASLIGEQIVVRRPGRPTARLRRREDTLAAARFLRGGDPEVLVDPRSPMGRDLARAGRQLLGERLALALGGGGAWGFAHVALIQSLEEAGLPIDLVTGSSMGVYAAGGMDALEALVARRRWLLPLMGAAMVYTPALPRFFDGLLGPVPIARAEVPFLPVAVDLDTGREVVLRAGTVTEGIYASARLAPMWPAVERPEGRLLDGALLNIVPASVAREAGADFVLAGNAIPRNPQLGNDRLSQGLKAACMLMWRSGRDRGRFADLTLDLGDPAVRMIDFAQAPRIIDRARERLVSWIPEIRSAWAAGAWRPTARREAAPALRLVA